MYLPIFSPPFSNGVLTGHPLVLASFSNVSLIRVKGLKHIKVKTSLTLFDRGQGEGSMWPPYHESVCHCHKVRATKTKLPDFVPFDNCQVLGKQFCCVFSRNWKHLTSKIFWGPWALGENQKKNEKIFFCYQNLFFQAQSEFYMFSAFIWGALHHKN